MTGVGTDMETVPILDRFEGCLIGLALGDALGAPYEFAVEPVTGVDGEFHVGYFGTAPGAPTDDSTLACFLAKSLVQSGGTLDPANYMGRLQKWLASGPPDVGAATARAIRTWQRFGRAPEPDEEIAGNGSLMACAPLGLVYAGHGLDAVAAGVEFSNLTHPSSRSARAVGFFVQSIARLVVDPRTPPPLEPQVRVPECFQPTAASIGLVTYCAAVAYTAACAIETPAEGFDALLDVIRLGGDTDTNAAVAGALIGARFGMAAWPEEKVKQLDLRDEALGLAHQLYGIARNR